MAINKLIIHFLIILLIPLPSWALHEDFEKSNYFRPAWMGLATVTALYYISEFENGPYVLAGLYSMGSFYLFREVYGHKNQIEDLIVPTGLATLAIVNLALLSDDEAYSKNDVFVYNLIGAATLITYGIWEHSQRSFRHTHRSSMFVAPTLIPTQAKNENLNNKTWTLGMSGHYEF